MSPDFTSLLITGVLFGLAVVGFIAWRFSAALDLFLDPIAVLVGYWVWLVESSVYYGIPLLNFVGWFVLTSLAPLAWILIARRHKWGYARKIAAAFAALIPLCIASALLSLALNATVATLGFQ